MLRRAGLALLVAGAFAVPAPATWSVVAVNVETGEVCVAGATCIATDLNRLLTVVRVGVGGAAAQSVIDTGGVNRLRIWEDFQLGKSPEAILADLAATDPSHQQRQYGIVTLEHDPVSFTGTGAFPAKRSLSGQVGPIKYAIQGNVLAGVAVAIQARNVFVNEPGDLTQKVMAAMLRARELGGDGRCSCSVPAPTSCGVPPPDFLRSCLSAFIVSARVGDTDGVCPMAGCANGDYFLSINFFGPGDGFADPVDRLNAHYLDWRAGRIGHVDHARTVKTVEPTTLVADGQSGATIVIEPRDIEGERVLSRSFAVEVEEVDADVPHVRAEPAFLDSEGRLVVKLRVGAVAGAVRLALTVVDGDERVRLAPDVSLRLTPTDDGLGGG